MNLRKPWLALPPKLAHDLAPFALNVLSSFRSGEIPEWSPLEWRGLHFPNRLGIAGGVDKNAESIEPWWKFGVGFIEIGTVTPKAQAPNEGKIIDRDLESMSLWNRMGFPGAGVDHVRANLIDLPLERKTPIFVNVGKNRSTPNERAARDYAACIDSLAGLADAFVVNISSPNTAGLRELLQPAKLRGFLSEVLLARAECSAPHTPVLLKLSPDIEYDDLKSAVETSCQLGINGFIATNTTSTRRAGLTYPTEGGVSGQPLAERSKETLRNLLSALGSARDGQLIVSAGGVLTAHDVRERLWMGADLVQVYTALIYEGPWFFSRVAKEMKL
jgi:dihydroorotate dehydrogenase